MYVPLDNFIALFKLAAKPKLTSLNISTCIALRYLYCNDNLLTELDLSNCTMLRDLSCQNNELH